MEDPRRLAEAERWNATLMRSFYIQLLRISALLCDMNIIECWALLVLEACAVVARPLICVIQRDAAADKMGWRLAQPPIIRAYLVVGAQLCCLTVETYNCFIYVSS